MPGSDTKPSVVVRGCLDSCSPPVGTNYVIDCCTTDFCNKAISIPSKYGNDGTGNNNDNNTPYPTLIPIGTTTKSASCRVHDLSSQFNILALIFVFLFSACFLFWKIISSMKSILFSLWLNFCFSIFFPNDFFIYLFIFYFFRKCKIYSMKE